jgi:hypothetical protein
MSWAQDSETLLSVYEQLYAMPQSRLLEILGEWEMREKFGTAADHVWADEWPKAVARVETRYRPSKFRPRMTGKQMIGGIWTRAFGLSKYDDDPDEAHLCPYGCVEHSIQIAPEKTISN